MRVVLQRAKGASVRIEGEVTGRFEGPGLVVLLGIEERDSSTDIDWLVGKIVKLRIFADEQQAMNRSVQDVEGDILIVSQFTLHASTKKGNRPSFIAAARPETAIPLYESFVRELSKALGKPVSTGRFGADMQVELVNDGPVTIVMDSHQKE